MVTKLYNAFPNPFNPNTNIRYSLKEAGKVKIEIYNMKGQKIKTYNLEHTSPGYYQVSWDSCDDKGRSVASGIYLYRLSTGNYTSAKKMVLAK
jgi:flagellar hook assembly protein FlgD